MKPLLIGIASGSLSSGVETPHYLDRVKASGAKGLRAQAVWPRMQPDLGGPIDLTSYEKILDWCDERDLALCGGLGARDDHTYDHVDEYVELARIMAAEFGSRLAYFELGNEVDHVRTDVNPSPARYMNLHLRAYEAMKNECPTLRIGNGGIGGQHADWGDTTSAGWWAQCYDYGLQGNVDVAMFHMYPGPGRISQSVADRKRDGWLLREAHTTSRQRGDLDLPFVLSEIGWHTGSTRNPISEADQADRVRNSAHWCERHDWLEAMFWFTLDDQEPDPNDPNNTGDTTGLVRLDGSPKPSYYAFGSVA